MEAPIPSDLDHREITLSVPTKLLNVIEKLIMTHIHLTTDQQRQMLTDLQMVKDGVDTAVENVDSSTNLFEDQNAIDK